MKKILILVNHDVVIYNFRKELVERLLKEDYQIYLSSPYGERIDFLIQLGCIYIETPLDRHGKNMLKELELLQHYKKLMKQVKPDVVLTYTIKPNIYGGLAAQQLKIPYIANITGLGSSVDKPGVLQKIVILLQRKGLSKANCIFFQNKSNQEFFETNRIKGKKQRLICGSGVNLAEFQILPYPQEVRFAFVARIMKEKGIEEFLECAKILKKKFSNVYFDVCGFCEEKYETILQELSSQNVITYHGMVKDMKNFLSQVQCVVLPSYHEGMSNSLLEAAATGRVLIASDIPGCCEIIEEGKNGYCCHVQDSVDLLKKMEKFLSLSYQQKYEMGLYGRKKVEQQFDRNLVINAYLQEIQNV